MCVHAAQSSLLVAECEFRVRVCVWEARLLLLLVCVCVCLVLYWFPWPEGLSSPIERHNRALKKEKP